MGIVPIVYPPAVSVAHACPSFLYVRCLGNFEIYVRGFGNYRAKSSLLFSAGAYIESLVSVIAYIDARGTKVSGRTVPHTTQKGTPIAEGPSFALRAAS